MKAISQKLFMQHSLLMSQMPLCLSLIIQSLEDGQGLQGQLLLWKSRRS